MSRLLTGVLLLAMGTGAVVADSMPAMPAMPGMPEHHSAQATTTTSASSTDTAPQTDGEIRKVDTAAEKLTVRHGPIVNLGMSAMTMVFRVKDPAFLTMVKPGDKVKMTVERVDGALTIVALERVP